MRRFARLLVLSLSFPLALPLAVAACRAGEAPALVAGDPARGFALIAERGCTSCHASPDVAREPAPRLADVGARLTPRALETALSGGPRMPDCLAGLAKRERGDARAALTHYLASRGGPLVVETTTVDALTVERGRQLYHAIGCVACHAPFEAADTLAKPLWEYEDSFEPMTKAAAPTDAPRDPQSLAGLGERTALAPLARTLADPLAVHPAGRMPSLGLSGAEATDVAAYLLYEDAAAHGAVLADGPGLQLDYCEGSFPGDTVDFDALAPVRSEVATSFFEGIARREEDFAFRFRGLIRIDAAGRYRFTTRSDDGSMLYVDGKLVVDNRGQHAPASESGELHLSAGRHALEVTYFEHMGGNEFAVSWSGPGFEERPLGFEGLTHLAVELRAAPEPFALDPELVERGRALYDALGCAACHDGTAGRAAPLARLDPARGCLAEDPEDAPRHRLDARERADLVAALRAGVPPPRTAEQRLADELVRLDCVACHARDGRGGPDDARRSYFLVADGLDLGDEGRLPPTLDRVGGKLKPAWFHEVLERGGRARPYMKTRMPSFGAANVAALPALFAEVDAALRDEREPPFSADAVAAGKELAGTKGLGCIQCHELAGHPSIGIPAVDLAKVHERIYPGWFRALLMDPVALKMNTRMPAFWVDGKSPVTSVCGGDPAPQVDALWTYLSLGSSMPLPFGLVPLEGEYEVEVTDTPVCVGVFMEGVSPRTLCVGLPERVHYAFDVQNSRLAKAWRGRFFDAKGTWFARAGQLEKPAGEDVLEFAPGEALMMLDARDDPWPSEMGRAAGYRGLGRSFDVDRRPTFAYLVCGVHVEETVEPVVRAGGAGLRRRFSIPLEEAGENLFLRAAVGDSVERENAGTWLVRGERELRVVGLGERAFVHRDESGRMELRFPIDRDSATRTSGVGSVDGIYEVEYSW